jgi:hypothetical protein
MALDSMQQQEQAVEQLAVPSFEKPIPGESLTNDPDSPMPFEGPPEITQPAEGINYLFLMITSEEAYPDIMGSIREEVPLSEIAQLILFEGFMQGKWNPDMLMLLFEPLIYMLMALSEKVQIEYVLYPGEDKDDKVLNDEQSVEMLRKIAEIAIKDIGRGNKVTSLPAEIQQRLEEFKPKDESLLAKEEEKEEDTITPSISLMQKQI